MEPKTKRLAIKIAAASLLVSVLLTVKTMAQGVCVLAEKRMSEVTGLVILPNKIPIDEAVIEVHEKSDDGQIVAKGRTDKSGHFGFTDLKEGKYVISVSYPTLVTFYVRLSVTKKPLPKNVRQELVITLNGLIGKPCGGGDVQLLECTVK